MLKWYVRGTSQFKAKVFIPSLILVAIMVLGVACTVRSTGRTQDKSNPPSGDANQTVLPDDARDSNPKPPDEPSPAASTSPLPDSASIPPAGEDEAEMEETRVDALITQLEKSLHFERRKQKAQDCNGILSDPRELELLKFISSLNKQFFQGELTLSLRDQRLAEFLRSQQLLADSNESRSIVAMQDGFAIQEFKRSLFMRGLVGQGFTESDKKVVEKLKLSEQEVRKTVQVEMEKLKPYFSLLIKLGAGYDLRSGWDFSNVSITPSAVKKDPALLSALSAMVSPQMAQALADEDRQDAVRAGESVFALTFRKGLNKGLIRAFKFEDYTAEVKHALKRFSEETEAFIQDSKSGAAYSNLMSGQLRSERGNNGLTAPEIGKNSHAKLMASYQTKLIRELGVPEPVRRGLIQSVRTANQLDLENIETGIKKIRLAKTAALSAPFIPVAMYLAPAALAFGEGALGTAGSLLASGTGATGTLMGGAAAGEMAVVSFAAMPLAFGAGSAILNATVKSSKLGGSFLCNFEEEALMAAAGGLSSGAKMAFIPIGGSVVAGGAGLAAGAQGASRAKAVFDTATALYFLKQMGTAVTSGFASCQMTVEHIHSVAQVEGDPELVEVLTAQAYEECLQAGIDLGFLISSSGKLLKSAHDSYNARNSLGGVSVKPDDLARDLREIQAGMSAEQISAANRLIFESLSSEPVTPASGKKLTGIDQKTAALLLKKVAEHKVAGHDHLSKYDPNGGIGFCFGRALAAHLEALALGVDKNSVRKVWLAGSMKAGDITWGHHVATIVRREGGGWWVIDSNHDKPMTVESWYKHYQKYNSDGRLRLFVTDAKRWGPANDAPYTPAALNDPFYNDYFVHFLKEFRSERASRLPRALPQ